MHARCSIGPPEERLRKRRAVVQPHFQFEYSAPWVQADAVHPLHALHRIVIAAPDGDGAVLRSFNLRCNRHERRRSVVLRPVEFNAARDPRPCESYQRRLDDVLAIEEIVASGLVVADVNAPSDLRQDHEPQVFVFDMKGFPRPRRRLSCDAVDERERVHLAAAALVHAPFQEHRIPFRRARCIGEDLHILFPRFNRPELLLQERQATTDSGRGIQFLLRIPLAFRLQSLSLTYTKLSAARCMCKPSANFSDDIDKRTRFSRRTDCESGEFAISEVGGIVQLPLRDGWEFRLDPSGATEPSDSLDHAKDWEAVYVPHTWQSLGRSPDYVGVAWYRIRFEAPASWDSQHLRVEFEAVNHTAAVFLNGRAIGEHTGKGYTAFTLDLSAHLSFGQENTLLVRVDNRPNDRMLPRNKSYDWTDDGGIIRPVNLLVTAHAFIESVEIGAVPDLANGSAEIRVRATVRNVSSQTQKANVRATIRRDGSSNEVMHLGPIDVALEADREQLVDLGQATLQNAALWHFDTPHLYRAIVEMNGPSGVHEVIEQFGIRKFEVRGPAFYLNGEQVSLIGVERMAGSHPELGFAETRSGSTAITAT